MCSSGNQAQIAASMASTEAQAEAARNALAFTREQFEYMKGLRKPYTDAGASATTMLMNLLGLQLPNYNPGPGGTLPPITGGGGGGTGGGGGAGGAGSPTGGGTGGGGTGGGGTGGGGTGGGGGGVGLPIPGVPTGGFTGEKFPNTGGTPYSPAFDSSIPGSPGYEPRYPAYDWTGQNDVPNPNQTVPNDWVPGTPLPEGSSTPTPWVPGTPTSGLVTVTNSTTGETRQVPTSLVSFYTASGWQ